MQVQSYVDMLDILVLEKSCRKTYFCDVGSRKKFQAPQFSFWVPWKAYTEKLELVEKQKRGMEEMVAMIMTLKAQIEENESKYQQQHEMAQKQGSDIRKLRAQLDSVARIRPMPVREA